MPIAGLRDDKSKTRSFWSNRSRQCGTTIAGVSGILCAGPGFPSGSDEAFAEHDGELGLGLGPFARRHFPFPDDLAQDEKDELRRRLIARKMASRSHRSP